MQSTLKSAGLLRVGSKPTRLPTPQRPCVAVRSCASAPETPSLWEQNALAIASFLTSTIVAVTSASPALADETVAASISPLVVETTSAIDATIKGAEVLDAPAEVDASEVTEAPPVVVQLSAVAASPEELVTAPALAQATVQGEELSEQVTAALSAPPVTVESVAVEPVVAAEPVAIEEEAVEPVAADEPVAVGEPVGTEAASPIEYALSQEAATFHEIEAVEAPVDPPAAALELVEPASNQTAEGSVIAEDFTPSEISAGAGIEVDAVQEVVQEAAEPIPVAPVEAAALEVAEPIPMVAEDAPVQAVAPELSPVTESVVVVEDITQAAAPPAAAPAAGPEPAAADGLNLQALFTGVIATASSGEGPSAETITYGVLGATVVAFIATFFVAPRFKEAFKEPVDWRDMYAALAAKGVKTLTAEEAYAKAKKGAVILDVRLADSYAGRAAEPSVNVPLYQPIAGWGLASNIRRAGFAFFGIFGTELNENFLAEVAAKVPKNKEVIVMCETGGSIENKPGTQFGFQSRSLKALYYLQQAGYSKAFHAKGGLGDWQRTGLPLAEATGEAAAQQKSSQQRPAAKGSVRGGTTAGTSSGTGRGTSSRNRVPAKERELQSATTRGRK